MNALQVAFPGHRHVVLPVIHAESAEQSFRNAQIARDAGSDGIFLINHAISTEELLPIAAEVRKRFGAWWIGINCLGLEPHEVFRLPLENVNGVWVDNALIEEQLKVQVAADYVQAVRRNSGWTGLYFGGVAFKYQRAVEDLEPAARTASRYMEVVTTSGPGTGQAAPYGKIARLKSALGTHPLAIASGITVENVREYLPVADCFLVATGISRTFSDFSPARVQALVRTVRDFPG